MKKNTFKYDTISVYSKNIGRFSLPEDSLRITAFPTEFTNSCRKQCQMHTHDFYCITWVEQGDFEYHIDSQKIKSKGKVLLVLSPGEVHYLKSDENLYGVSVNFTEDFFHYMPKEWATHIKKHVIKKTDYLNVTNNESESKIKKMMNLLKEFSEEEQDCQLWKMKAYSALTMLLCEITKITEFKEMDSHFDEYSVVSKEIYQLFIDRLEECYKEQHSVKFYAENLQISISTLANYCKQNAGLRPLEIVNHRILLEAKKLLIFTQMRGKEIAMSLGFNDQAHFANFFKRLTGMTPSEFRKKSKTV